MARCARERKSGSVYHVKQTCLSGSCLFRTEEETNQFVALLEQLKRNSNFKLYGVYLSPDHFELLLYPEYADISTIMRSLMIQYANIKQQSTPLCKERFKSICISENGAFLEQLERFQQHSVERYDALIDSPQETLGLSTEVYTELLQDPAHVKRRDEKWLGSNLCIQSTACCISCIEQGKQALEDKLSELHLELHDLQTHKELRNKLVKWFRQNSTLTLKEIGHVLGDLSESTVSKILKAKTN